MRVVSLHLGRGPGLPKAAVEELHLVAGMGAEGDRHFGRNPDQAVLVAGTQAYARAAEAGIALPWGALGENLLLEPDPHALGPGARLGIGSALLELTSVCTVCDALSRFDLRLPRLLYGRRGLYARVLQGGLVRVGDEVRILHPPQPW